MGCLYADGRERLLERITNIPDEVFFAHAALVAAPFAALVMRDDNVHDGVLTDTMEVFDLRTGELRKDLGGESDSCPDDPACSVLDHIVLGHDGTSAAHWQAVETRILVATPLNQVSCAPATTLCIATDKLLDDILTSSDPTGGREAGPPASCPGEFPRPRLTCPSQSLCVGVQPGLDASSDPAAGAPNLECDPTARRCHRCLRDQLPDRLAVRHHP